MPASVLTDKRNSRVSIIFVVGATLACALFAYIGVKPDFSGANSDAAVYVLLADHYSWARELPAKFLHHLYSNYPLAPLFPVVLGVAGGGTGAPEHNYLINAALLGLAVGCVGYWARI